MSKRFDNPEDRDSLREKIIGLGERSFRKSYYPKLQQQLTELQRAGELIRETARRQEAILNSIPDMAWLKDRDGRYIAVNEAYGEISGLKPADIAGKTDLDIWPPKAAQKFMDDDREVMRSGKRLVLEEPLADRKGNLRWYETIKTPLYNERGEPAGTTGIARDITRRKQMEETIKYQAHHDLLTGLPNRMLFIDHLNLELSQAQRLRSMLAVLVLDLDRFKSVNDALGHTAGDLLLKEIAGRLASRLRDTDTIARIGDDEFTILLPHIAHTEDAARITEKILSSFTGPYTVNEQQLHITASVGISIYPGDGEYADTLLKNADVAMYQAKEAGRNTYQFYNTAINVRTIERIILENRLHQTIERRELAVYYQPLIDSKSGRIVCAEALVRWRHPELGVLDPVQFIPLAEEIGFVRTIDEWVLRTAGMQNRELQERGYPPICITVNLSSGQFQQSNLPDVVAHVLRESGLAPEFLGIEITESIAMKDTELTIHNLARLTDMGVKFSIDDFGTGYSSLSYLKRMPFQKLKIDKSFIRGLMKDPDYEAIVNAVIAMAHSLKLKVVAEGVETDEQLSFLRAGECDEVQGYLFSRPLPAEEFREMLASGK